MVTNLQRNLGFIVHVKKMFLRTNPRYFIIFTILKYGIYSWFLLRSGQCSFKEMTNFEKVVRVQPNSQIVRYQVKKIWGWKFR